MAMAIDPICGMEVDTEHPPATSEYEGQTYYFCSRGCKVAFDKNPALYVVTDHGDQGHGHMGHGEHEGR